MSTVACVDQACGRSVADRTLPTPAEHRLWEHAQRTLPPKETPMPIPSEKECSVITNTIRNACVR